MASSVVLDASAVLAVLFAEVGADAVIGQLPGALISCVNLAEVVTRAVDEGKPLEDTIRQIDRLPIVIVAYDTEQAHVTASLRHATKPRGLSLGDRACLALAIVRQLPVLTGDRDWRKLKLDLDVRIFR
jgi:PIN domain nuclease of toxin-antitoxin system